MVGEVQGVLTSMKALTEGLGPLLVSSLLQAFEGTALPGAPWLLCSCSAAVAVGLATRLEATIGAHRAGRTRGGAGRYAHQPDTEELAPRAEEQGEGAVGACCSDSEREPGHGRADDEHEV